MTAILRRLRCHTLASFILVTAASRIAPSTCFQNILVNTALRKKLVLVPPSSSEELLCRMQKGISSRHCRHIQWPESPAIASDFRQSIRSSLYLSNSSSQPIITSTIPPPSSMTTTSSQSISDAINDNDYDNANFQTTTTTTTTSLLEEATTILKSYEASQQTFIQSDGNQGMGGGISALHHIQSLDKKTRSTLQAAVRNLVLQAHHERERDSSTGRIMLGFCASNAPEALSGLKSWVTQLHLPRGMLHGMDVDGVPIPVEDLGAVYVKYSTGGAMTFSEMRKSKRGFDALWRPGDALLEMYDGEFRGVYLNVELQDGIFRQFGLLPTDLFMEEEEDDW